MEKKQLKHNDLFYRAQWVILRDFDQGFFAGIRECEIEKWPYCDARLIAEHVQESDPAANIYEVWHKFPGGFPRFLDMRDDIRKKAEKEQGTSTIDWFSCAMANEVLKADNIGGK